MASLQDICKALVDIETLIDCNLNHLITPVKESILLIPENMVLIASPIEQHLNMLKKKTASTMPIEKGTLLDYDAKMCAYLSKRVGYGGNIRVWKGTIAAAPVITSRVFYDFMSDLRDLCIFFENFTERPKELVHFDKFTSILKQAVDACCYKCGEIVSHSVMNLFIKPIVLSNIIHNYAPPLKLDVFTPNFCIVTNFISDAYLPTSYTCYRSDQNVYYLDLKTKT